MQVPVCLVSIVDDDHQWFKSNQGLACSSTDRKSSFCAWTLLPQHPELLIVEDALEDARYGLDMRSFINRDDVHQRTCFCMCGLSPSRT